MFRPLLTLLLVSYLHAAKLPETWKVCKQTVKQERDTCLKKELTDVCNELMTGKPSLGVLPLEPFHFDLLSLTGHGAASINITFTNYDFHNINSFVIEEVDSDWENYKFGLRLTFKSPLVSLGDYEVKGRILLLPVLGSGKCNLTFENFDLTVKFEGSELKKNNKRYFDVTGGNVKVATSRLHMKFDNLFNGDKALGENINKVINENWDAILQDLMPSLEIALKVAFSEIANRVFHKISLDQFT